MKYRSTLHSLLTISSLVVLLRKALHESVSPPSITKSSKEVRSNVSHPSIYPNSFCRINEVSMAKVCSLLFCLLSHIRYSDVSLNKNNRGDARRGFIHCERSGKWAYPGLHIFVAQNNKTATANTRIIMSGSTEDRGYHSPESLLCHKG